MFQKRFVSPIIGALRRTVIGDRVDAELLALGVSTLETKGAEKAMAALGIVVKCDEDLRQLTLSHLRNASIGIERSTRSVACGASFEVTRDEIKHAGRGVRNILLLFHLVCSIQPEKFVTLLDRCLIQIKIPNTVSPVREPFTDRGN